MCEDGPRGEGRERHTKNVKSGACCYFLPPKMDKKLLKMSPALVPPLLPPESFLRIHQLTQSWVRRDVGPDTTHVASSCTK